MSTLGKAIRIASEAFENKTDKAGKPYILHCLYVMGKVSHLGEEAMIVAVLHDLLEDCPKWSAEKLFVEGFSENVIFAIDVLTHRQHICDYTQYVSQIATNPIARAVKLADLEHNSQITRLKGLTKKDFDRIQKYHTAYEYLRKV